MGTADTPLRSASDGLKPQQAGSTKGAHCIRCDNQIPWPPRPCALQRGGSGLAMAVDLALEAWITSPGLPPARVGTVQASTPRTGTGSDSKVF